MNAGIDSKPSLATGWSKQLPQTDGYYFWIQVSKELGTVVQGSLSLVVQTDQVRGWTCEDGRKRDAHLSQAPRSIEMDQQFDIFWKPFDPADVGAEPADTEV